MEDHNTRTLSRSPSRKHLQSTFPSMMVDYMSGDELSKHLGRQMSIHNEKYKEPDVEPGELDGSKEKKKLKRKTSKLKKQQSHHGMILQGSDQNVQSQVTRQIEEEDVSDDEEQENLKKMKEKEHDEMVQGLLLLRDYYKAEYKKALQDKVDHQRKNMQQRQNKLDEEERLSQQHQQEMQHKVAHKLSRSVLVNDVQFRNGLQTDYYKIISLENQLKKEGYLTKSHEIKDFWNFITVPENLENVLEDGQISWERIQKYHKEHSKMPLTSQVEETTAQRRKPGVKKKLRGAAAISTWRSTTHGIRTILTPSTPGSEVASSGRKSSSHASSGKQRAKKTSSPSAIPIEQRFPKVEFPPLAAYRLEFGDPEPDPEEVRQQEEAYRRLQARNGLKRTLNTMFSHALANRAATQRLIDKNEEYNFESLSGASNLEEFHDLASVQLKPVVSANKKQQSRTSSSKSKVGSHKSVKSASRKTKSPEINSPDRSDSNMSFSSKEDLVVELPPLTLNKLSSECVVKEAKCLSTFWVNPMAKQDLNSCEG